LIEQTNYPVITIDGPSGSGKGTLARRIAKALNFNLLDSGALYRAVVVTAFKENISLTDKIRLSILIDNLNIVFENNGVESEKILLNGQDITLDVRHESTGLNASIVAEIPEVRKSLLNLQRSFLKAPGLIADGRDMGTHVFPSAPMKIFLTANHEVRAERRYKQLKEKGMNVNLAAVSKELKSRDQRDSDRLVAPLKAAEDAKTLDTSNLSIDNATNKVLKWFVKK
jgi:cytidylate kinase